jgi:DNA-binding phage protein
MDMNEERIDVLTERAATLAEQRDTIVTELKEISADMWRSGLQNVRDIGRRTTLSRTTVYAALRERGIEPTDRTTEK